MNNEKVFMKGFKAFDKGLICRGKQYKENAVFEESEANICKNGMHFCENPLDVLDYYPLIDDNGDLPEFAPVEALGAVVTKQVDGEEIKENTFYMLVNGEFKEV